MQRTITYSVDETSEGYSLSRFLKAKGYSARNITDLKHPEHTVLRNGVPIYMSHILHDGDILTIQINEMSSSPNIVPVNLPLDILYEDEDIIVVNKPAGMPVHPSMNNYTNSLANALAWYYTQQNKPFIFRCANRLDRDTSGVTLIAKHMISAGILSESIQKHLVEREYLAITTGPVIPECGRIEAPIGRSGNTSLIERKIDWENGEHAATNYRVVKQLHHHSLVSLRLETGRTHQIRIHMKYLGFPLIGDYLYYPDMTYISRQALHSAQIRFEHPITRELLSFEAPLPDDMQNAVARLSLK